MSFVALSAITLTLLFRYRGKIRPLTVKDKAKFYFKCNSFLLFIMHLPGGAEGRQSCKKTGNYFNRLGLPLSALPQQA